MAEYCSQCSPFKEFGEWDIDLLAIALLVESGHSVNFLCEGCKNRAIYKDKEGNLYLCKEIENELKLFRVNLEVL